MNELASTGSGVLTGIEIGNAAQGIAPHSVAISVAGVSKSYAKGPKVLKEVSLQIASGETVALIGSNGSGKSTLLKCLAGVHTVDAGHVEVFGNLLGPHPRQAVLSTIRRDIGYVFQNHGLVRRLNVLSNVIHGRLGDGGSWRAIHHAIAPAALRLKAMEALRMVGLEDKWASRADALSGGQAQRVAIARALIRKPKLLIADEPAASLDPAAGLDVMTAFCDVSRSQRTTLLFTTHDVDHALQFAGRIVALRNGEIIMDRPAETVSRSELQKIYR